MTLIKVSKYTGYYFVDHQLGFLCHLFQNFDFFSHDFRFRVIVRMSLLTLGACVKYLNWMGKKIRFEKNIAINLFTGLIIKVVIPDIRVRIKPYFSVVLIHRKYWTYDPPFISINNVNEFFLKWKKIQIRRTRCGTACPLDWRFRRYCVAVIGTELEIFIISWFMVNLRRLKIEKPKTGNIWIWLFDSSWMMSLTSL